MSMAGLPTQLGSPIAEGRVALIYTWKDGKILKLARDWVSPEWMHHEYNITSIVHASGLPIPRPYEIVEIDGATGILYDRADGPTMLDRIGTDPLRAARYGKLLGELHAEIHSRKGLPDLPDNRNRLRQRIESITEAPPAYQQTAIRALDALPDGQALLHGDFHPGNVILAADRPVVIDWPDASHGHPLADVARTVVLISLGGLPQNPLLRFAVSTLRNVFNRAYVRTYFKRSGQDRRELQRWLYPVIFARLAEGIESEREASIRWLNRLNPEPRED